MVMEPLQVESSDHGRGRHHRESTTAATLSLPSNVVHVLDLALFLPAVVASGALSLRQ
jgi:hypothetical protein